MTPEIEKFFIDTSPFIYLIEDYKEYSSKVLDLFTYCMVNDITIVTSTITYMEFCVKPYQENKIFLIEEFKNLLFDLNAEMININIEIADTGAKIRGKYKLRSFDALQIGCAIYCNCTKFISNDKKLKNIGEIEVKLIRNGNLLIVSFLASRVTGNGVKLRNI